MTLLEVIQSVTRRVDAAGRGSEVTKFVQTTATEAVSARSDPAGSGAEETIPAIVAGGIPAPSTLPNDQRALRSPLQPADPIQV
jgi:hypothetical protein